MPIMAKFYYGGQALIEGVMMRGGRSVAAAIRRPDGSTYLYEEALNPRIYQNRLFRLPFLRGLFLLWEMLVLGTRLMTMSANIASGAVNPDVHPTAPASNSAQTGTNGHQPMGEAPASLPADMAPPQIGGVTLVVTLLISRGFAILIFFLAPLFIANLFPSHIGA